MLRAQSHRPGLLKQVNKSHKSKYRSKGSLDVISKGKVGVKEFTKRKRHELKKDERRHQLIQIRKNKREEVLLKKRSLGGGNTAPILTCIIPLNAQLHADCIINILSTCSSNAVVTKSTTGIIHIGLPSFKQRFSFICPEVTDEFATLDALKAADSVILLASAVDEPIDKWGEQILASSMAQGLPTPTVAVTDFESLNPKKRKQSKQEIQKIFTKWLPEEKIFAFEKNSDGLNMFRRLGNQKRKVIHQREKRPHLLSEHIQYICPDGEEEGILKVDGFLRGVPLSANDLIHVVGLGDFQMTQIDGAVDPYPLDENKVSMGDLVSMNGVRILEYSDPNKQVSLLSEITPDPMDAEQTFPDEEEIKMANEETKRRIKRIPKGMSAYQATWIVDEEIEDESDISDEENEHMSCASEEISDNENNQEEQEFDMITESEIGVTDEKYDAAIDAVEEHEMLEKIKAAKEDWEFPDEVDTPQDTPASERFGRYRGLESFRTSPWDPKENLPVDYAKIFQFENFDHTRKRILKETNEKEGVQPGWYITIHIKGVPKDKWNAFQSTRGEAPLTVFGLLPNEHKMSVMNVILKRTGISEEPIKSKEKLVFQCGYRRFIVDPIFSQHTNGNKHKYERYLQPASTCVATFFAPIQFNPASVLCYKIKKDTNVQLVASGSLMSCNPDRIIIKRIVLSGHPLKVNKRSTVVRFMFFNREDVLYFKPCKLRTKYGRTGHIKEPLGTHGHMKCVFDGQLKSQDTILLNLFKRVFPKWTYENCIISKQATSNKDSTVE